MRSQTATPAAPFGKRSTTHSCSPNGGSPQRRDFLQKTENRKLSFILSAKNYVLFVGVGLRPTPTMTSYQLDKTFVNRYN